MISFKASAGRTYCFESYEELEKAVREHPQHLPENNEPIWEIRIDDS